MAAVKSGDVAEEEVTSVDELKDQVTSPGGTTAAALSVLMTDDRLRTLMTDAIRAARDRGEELSRG